MTHDFKFRIHPIIGSTALTALLLTGCSAGHASGEDGETPTDGTTRTVSHALGQTDVPTEPGAVVALDELAGLNALLSGIEPELVYASLGDSVSADILRDSGVEVQEAEVLSVPDREELLNLDPDLLVGTGAEGPAGTSYEELSEVAPTVVIDVEGDWRDIVLGAADAFSAEDLGQRQIEAVEAHLSAAKELTTADPRELALFGYSTESFTMPEKAPSSVLVKEAGFTRPAAEQIDSDSYSAPFSLEVLDEHEAELMAIPDGPGYPSQEITQLKAFDRLDGTAVHPVAQQWFGNSALSFWVIARDLETLAAGDEDVITGEEIPDEWDELLGQVKQ